MLWAGRGIEVTPLLLPFYSYVSKPATHEAVIEILNLKIIDKHRRVKNLNFRTEYGRDNSIKVVNLIANGKVTCGDLALTDYIERVVSSVIDIALIGVKTKQKPT